MAFNSVNARPSPSRMAHGARGTALALKPNNNARIENVAHLYAKSGFNGFAGAAKSCSKTGLLAA